MKVLYVVTAFPRFEGDVITPWLVETIRRLQDQDIRVDVFTSAYQGLKQNWVHGINVYRFRYFFRQWEKLTHDETVPDRLRKGILNKLLVVSYLFCGTIGIIRHCTKNKYDVIHCHWPFPHIIFGYAASRFGKSKLISSFYGVELRWVKSKLPIFKPLLKFAIKKSDAVTAISSYTAKEVKEITPADIAIIPFGAAITISDQRVSMIKEKATKDILFVGRLVERKGVRYLIEAFDIITQKTPAKLTIVGTGSEMKNLEELTISKGLQDKIIFAGAIGAPQLEEFYRNCDVFVLPAIVDSKGDTEGLGVVLLEAMSYKKPVIGTNLGGIIDIIKDGKTGLLVDEKNPELLAQAISRILGNESFAQQLAENGYNYARGQYGWDVIISRLIKLYAQTQ